MEFRRLTEKEQMDYEIARKRMVREQIIERGVSDSEVLKVMSAVPRHLFVDQAFWPRAYSDHPLPISHDQTISQPYIVALMSQELRVSPGDKVLEIGTGSGYQTAVLALLGCTVFTIERIDDLKKRAEKVLRKLKIRNVTFKVGDGSIGWQENAPFDGIVVTAGSPTIPESLHKQLAVGGRLVIPVGGMNSQRLITVIRGEKIMEKHDICTCSFVPLIGEKAWNHE